MRHESDLETEDMVAALSQPDPDLERPGPNGWTRRKFLTAVGAGAIGAVASTELFGGVPSAWAAPLTTSEGIIVTVTMYGGYDGLNVVVPYTNSTYYGRRPGLAIAPEQVLQINNAIGWAPQLTTLKSLYDSGQVAVVQGVGYANPNLSHFDSMKIWMRGSIGNPLQESGWLGRWLDGLSATSADLAAAGLNTLLPMHLVGANRKGVTIPIDGNNFGASSVPADLRLYDGIKRLAANAGRGGWHDAFTATMKSQLEVASLVAPTFTGAAAPAGDELTRQLTVAARLINANLGLRVIDVSTSGLDHHVNQAPGLTAKLTDLDRGLAAFFAELAPGRRPQVTVVVLTEFGRTIGVNGSLGTDHGTTNPMFLIGSKVNGGLYGSMPSLTTLDSHGRQLAQVDFRSIYGSILDGWMGGGGSTVLGGSFEDLRLFSGPPGPGTTPTPTTPTTTAP
ncbi:MAG: DUF1501 domain-containing protein, partial [Ilumatobacteraceae bacterium]